MPTPWYDLLAAATGGGLLTKLLDLSVRALERRAKERRSARGVVERHLDPILKSVDELAGKLRALAVQDFAGVAELALVDENDDLERRIELCYLLYLFCHCWARISILRRRGLFVRLSADKTGRKLMAFVRTLENRHFRVIPRASQRTMGEALLVKGGHGLDCLSLYEFAQRYCQEEAYRTWFEPLENVLCDVEQTSTRQRVLAYGVILHAMLDTLDTRHAVSSDRPGYANKLSKRTRRRLRYQLFEVYLPFVKEIDKYLAAPRPV